MEPTIDQFVQLRRSVQRMKWLVSTLVIGAILLVCFRSTGSTSGTEGGEGVISAHRIELVNEQGTVIAALESKGGEGTFWVGDKSGSPTVVIMSETLPSGSVGTVTTTNKTGRPVVRLGIDSDGDGMVSAHDRNGRSKASIGTATNSCGSVAVYGQTEDPTLLLLGAESEGGGRLLIANKDGQRSVTLASLDGAGALIMNRADGSPYVAIGSVSDEAAIELLRREKSAAIKLAITGPATSALSVCNKQGIPSALVGVDFGGEGYVVTMNENGKSQAGLRRAADGSGVVETFDLAGKLLTTTSADSK